MMASISTVIPDQITATVQLPPKLVPVFAPPRGSLRYRGAKGGRGSGKSQSFACMAAIYGYSEPLRILCTRAYQNSIRESFHAELRAAIHAYPWLDKHYEVTNEYIRGRNGTEFMFRGLQNNYASIRSLRGIDLCIIEEAEDISEQSWVDLEPTIRTPKSEIWAIWNPRDRGSPMDKHFVQASPPRCRIATMNYLDNPWFPGILEEQRLHALKTFSDSLYRHIWEGDYNEQSEAQVYADCYRIEEFEPADDWDGPYYGLDFGFANDPTAAIKIWIYNDHLYIEHEAGRAGLELDDTASYLIQRIPRIEKHVIRCDNARPESISYLRRHGLPRAIACQKGQGSVKDGIALIRSFKKMIIHPRCQKTVAECRLYSYKTNRAGDPLPDLSDAYNHYLDALRYALEPLLKKNRFNGWSKII